MNNREIFIHLVQIGIGVLKDAVIPEDVDWAVLKGMADEQGLSAIVLDALNTLGADSTKSMPTQLKLEWIGEVVRMEAAYKHQQDVAVDMAGLFHWDGIRTYVLKGNVIAECYPRPDHRVSSDIDCFLTMGDGSHEEAWRLGNELIRAKHFDVNTDFYKNSTFEISGVVVENHRYLVPFRGNERLASLEKVLQAMLRDDRGEDVIEGTWLYRPPVMVSALFLIEHAYSHFLHEGLTWRMVLDWVMFKKMHEEEIVWEELEKRIDGFGFQQFYDSYSRLGQHLMGEINESELTGRERRMMEDVWAPLDVHDTVRGLKGKLALAGNTWRARWKYRYFTDMNWMQAMWIQAKGVLFDKNPRLN